MRLYLTEKFVVPVVQLLRQGVSPEKISLSIAWGVVIGIFPIVGATTLLCIIAAIVLRLNLPVIQLANWLVYPLQLVLLAPFFLAGAYLFGSEPFTRDVQEMIFLFQSDLIGAVILMKGVILNAVLVWLCVAPAGIILLHRALMPILKRIPLHRYSGQSDGIGYLEESNNAGNDRRIS